MGHPAAGNSLSVVCVSAAKYLDILEDKPRSVGFPSELQTKIPQLRKVLVETTLEARHGNANATLKELEALVLSIRSWATSLDNLYHLTTEERELIEDKFEEIANETFEVSLYVNNWLTDWWTLD
jgi:hypothetical protein